MAIYDGPAIDDRRLVGRYCGGDPYKMNLPGRQTRSSGQSLTVQFFAHPDGGSRWRGGFQAVLAFTYGESSSFIVKNSKKII